MAGVDSVLVDASRGLESDMAFVGEHLGEPVLLSLGQELSPGSGYASDTVERVTRAASTPQGFLLDALAAVPCRGNRRGRGPITVTALGQFLDRGGLVAGQAVHRDNSPPSFGTPRFGLRGTF